MTELEISSVVKEMREAVGKLVADISEIKSDIRHLTQDSARIADHDKRLSALESRYERLELQINIYKEVAERQSTNNKWLIGVTVASVLSVCLAIYNHSH